MNRKAFTNIAASSLILGVAAVGCAMGAGNGGGVKAASAAKTTSDAARAAALARKAMVDGKAALAVEQAEAAVALSPRAADFRALLGQAYLSDGRFGSAATAFEDALALDPAHAQAVLSLALARVALGDSAGARTLLDDKRDLLRASDLGLALALAGDPAAAIEVLSAAARADDANAKTRQNLALAYALAGRWQEAQVVAARDVAKGELTRRMMEWAQFAQPQQASDQVAALLGVTPAAVDPGQPQRLALGPVTPVTEERAFAEAPAEPADIAADAPVETAMSDAPVETPPATFASVEQAAVPAGTSLPHILFAPRAEVVQPIPVRAVRAAAPAATPEKPLLLRVAAPARQGNFVVQLHAFSNAANAERAWERAVGRHGWLADYVPTAASVSVGQSTKFHRLSASGFSTRGEANQACARIRASGGDCFVRATSGDSPVRWASRAPRRVASR